MKVRPSGKYSNYKHVSTKHQSSRMHETKTDRNEEENSSQKIAAQNQTTMQYCLMPIRMPI